MDDIDNTDRRILYELDLNSRQPITILAKALRISRDVASYRIRNLEKKGIIRKYHAVIDVSRLGYKMFRVYFKFFSINSDNLKQLTDALNSNDSVFWLGETDGFIDLVFGYWAKSDKEFNIFYTSLMKRFRKFIKSDMISALIHYNYLDRIYLSKTGKAGVRREEIIGGNEKTNFDDIDIKILSMLSNNAREPVIGIAKKIGMDSSAVIYRIKSLEKRKIIIGYKADIDFHLLKRYFYSVKFYLNNFERIKEMTAYLKLVPYLTNMTDAIGSYDVEIDLEVLSQEEYFNFIKDIKDRFDFISEIQFYRITKNYKILDMPSL